MLFSFSFSLSLISQFYMCWRNELPALVVKGIHMPDLLQKDLEAVGYVESSKMSKLTFPCQKRKRFALHLNDRDYKIPIKKCTLAG